MCGIFGIVGNNYDKNLAIKSIESLKHRGVDATCYKFLDNGFLGHTRLSIIDPYIEANQPMNDGEVSIVFNGEIYNFSELKKELDYPFKTTSDTEVIIASYLKWGIDFVNKLVGMFAIAIVDRDKLYLIRDRFGKKPLYYSCQNSKLIFASEIKAITPHLNSKTLNQNSLLNYLSFLSSIAPDTFYDEVSKIPAGYYLKYQNGDIELKQYYYLKPSYDLIESESLAIELIEEQLLKSVDYRLVSDVEVGAFLSGGIDSSLVSAIAKKKMKSLKTFSIGYDEYKSYDEREYAKVVAKHINSDHYELEISKSDFLNAIPKVIYHLDEPLCDSACVPTYLLSQFVASHGLKVALVGEGSDESFLGYSKYFEHLDIEKAGELKHKNWLKNFLNEHISLNKEWEWYRRAFSDEVIYRTIGENFTDLQKEMMLNIAVSKNHSLQVISKYYSEFKNLAIQNHALWYSFIDFKIWISEVLMSKVDRMSMAHSLELRAPFMESKLIELAFSISPNLRIGSESKYLLKKIARKYIPSEIVDRKKKGFSYPFIEWLHSSKELDIILDMNRVHNIFKSDKLEYLIKESKKGKFKQHVYALYIFSLWYQKEIMK